MNVIYTIIGVVGSLASIIGAYISLKAKKDAKSSAEIAEKAKNQVLTKQKTSVLVALLYEAKKIQQVFGKYSIAKSTRSLAGVEFKKDAELLQDFIFKFNENRAIIEQITNINSLNTYNELNSFLDKFSQSNTAEKRVLGKQICMAIDDIIYKMKKSIDDKNSEVID